MLSAETWRRISLVGIALAPAILPACTNNVPMPESNAGFPITADDLAKYLGETLPAPNCKVLPLADKDRAYLLAQATDIDWIIRDSVSSKVSTAMHSPVLDGIRDIASHRRDAISDSDLCTALGSVGFTAIGRHVATSYQIPGVTIDNAEMRQVLGDNPEGVLHASSTFLPTVLKNGVALVRTEDTLTFANHSKRLQVDWVSNSGMYNLALIAFDITPNLWANQTYTPAGHIDTTNFLAPAHLDFSNAAGSKAAGVTQDGTFFTKTTR